MYNFTSFALTLNEMEPGMEGLLAPTDCRLRPDLKAMEDGDLGKNTHTQCVTLNYILIQLRRHRNACTTMGSIVSFNSSVFIFPFFCLQMEQWLKRSGLKTSREPPARSAPKRKKSGPPGLFCRGSRYIPHKESVDYHVTQEGASEWVSDSWVSIRSLISICRKWEVYI